MRRIHWAISLECIKLAYQLISYYEGRCIRTNILISLLNLFFQPTLYVITNGGVFPIIFVKGEDSKQWKVWSRGGSSMLFTTKNH